MLVAAYPGARLVRLEQCGLSAARNAGAWAARTPYIAYIDDDAVPAADWVERILEALSSGDRPAALIGGRILPRWDAPLPGWWPQRLRGVLSIIEAEGSGEFRSLALPPGLEPYGANIVVHVLSLLADGGFGTAGGRRGNILLSDEEVQLAWRLQDAGQSVRYDSRIVVEHRIHADRLTPAWLLSRLFWQGASAVLTRRALRRPGTVWRELPRRIAVLALFAPLALVPRGCPLLIRGRWRLAYAAGFILTTFGWRAAAMRRSRTDHAIGSAALAAIDPG
jgi:GT2 family glycosyltransferase